MSIIVITIPDARKQKFVAKLQQQTAGAVSLVVLQDRPPPTWRDRWRRWRTQSVGQLARASFFAILLRLRKDVRSLLQVFHSPVASSDSTLDWNAPVVRVTSVNDPLVRQAVAQIEPAVVAVWGSGMLHPETIAPATAALNVHLGISTKYRGAYANQRAVEQGDWQNIGATIHHINGQADAGAVIKTIPATLHDTPEATFTKLHDAVELQFTTIIKTLLRGETPPAIKPDLTHSENVRLADWTPDRRWRVAQQLRQWPQAHFAKATLAPVRIRIED